MVALTEIAAIRRRGDVLAARLAKKMGIEDVGSIDITLYRDDLSETGAMARVGKTNIPFSVEGREIILCDDVIMTGRSVLAALREILDFGRPSRVHMAVLVERWGLGFLTTAFFVALLAGFWRGRGDALPWLVAGAVAVAVKLTLPGTWYIIAGAVAGSLLGAWRDSR